MNNNQNYSDVKEENILSGAVGAFLFSLAGGVIWYILYQVGFIAGIAGIVGVICAFKGYEIFAKGMSKKGIIISTVMAMLVIIIAWYLCLSTDVFQAYQAWYEAGEVERSLSFFESVASAWLFLTDVQVAVGYLFDLIIGLVFCVIGIVPQVKIMSAKIKPAQDGNPQPDLAPEMQIGTAEDAEQNGEANSESPSDSQ